MNIIRHICFIAAMAVASASFAITPQEALSKAKSKVSAAKSLSVSFTMKGGNQNVSGKILEKGKKFVITTNVSSNWYNGTDLYTYIPQKGETTIFRPTTDELAQVNPLVYIQAAANFNIMGSKTSKAGCETVVLIPKKNGTGVKSVTLELDSKTFLPKVIKLTPSSGGTVVINVTNVTLNSNISDSSFEYPKSKYPKAKIIDMR